MSAKKTVFPICECFVCSKEFSQTRSNRVYCSKDCAKRGWAKRKGKEYFRERYASDPKKFTNYQNQYRESLKERCFVAYGGYKCSCTGCSEINPKFLTLDHISNDGAAHRKELGKNHASIYRWLIVHDFPPIVQVLCFNCNCGKNVNGGVCPHLTQGDKHAID